MATIRRLSDDDVRSVFEAVHENRQPPHHLKFQIVPVGPEGLKLSPPSFEFDDGLYILLKPQKKKKSLHAPAARAKVPSNLMTSVMPEIPPPNCPWSLSGPQFPQPTAIQQRYCYPKGDADYSSKKGGALWTMYGTDGKEDLEYRLLHVYFSAKRAVNKGVKMDPTGLVAPPAKRIKRVATPPISRFDEDSLDGSDRVILPAEPPFNFVTPDVNEFGRFHPVAVAPSASNSPFQPRAIHPWLHGSNDLDSFQLNMMEEPSTAELESLWTDPMVPNHFEDSPHRIRRFANKLDEMHEHIKDTILLAAQSHETGHLVSLVSDWARRVAANPLGEAEFSIEKV